MSIRRCGKLSSCDIRCPINLDFGLYLLYLCLRRNQASPQHSSYKQAYLTLHSVCNDFGVGNKGSTTALISCTWALTDEKTVFLILFIQRSLTSIVLQQKVRLIGLSETWDAWLNFTTSFCDWGKVLHNHSTKPLVSEIKNMPIILCIDTKRIIGIKSKLEV